MTKSHVFGPEMALFSHAPMARLSLQERVRHRFKTLVDTKDVSHEILGKWLGLSRSGVTRLLNDEGSGFALHHIERLCEFFHITPAEVVLEPGALVQPLSPLEAAIVDVIRKMDRLRQHSLLDVLEWQRSSSIPDKRKRASLSAEDEMVLSLYRGMVDSDAQAGIVMQMRGFVRAQREDGSGPKRGGQ